MAAWAGENYQDLVAKSDVLIFPEFFDGNEGICALDLRVAKSKTL